MHMSKPKFVIARLVIWCSLTPADLLILGNMEEKSEKTSGHNQNYMNFSTVFCSACMEARAAILLELN